MMTYDNEQVKRLVFAPFPVLKMAFDQIYTTGLLMPLTQKIINLFLVLCNWL